ncbi:MAG: hypothetical protein OXU20_04760 [Myxococcales bacterium]|nr:hypothetical protein [Myxococcales bacterium]MDD9969214.1 hypothetical protein [Myxococcales bacterium]
MKRNWRGVLWLDQRGIGLLEYIIVLGAAALLCLVAVTEFGGSVQGRVQRLVQQVLALESGTARTGESSRGRLPGGQPAASPPRPPQQPGDQSPRLRGRLQQRPTGYDPSGAASSSSKDGPAHYSTQAP